MLLTRRTLLHTSMRLAPATALSSLVPMASAAGQPARLWIGTGTEGTGSTGIYLADWDATTGLVGLPRLAAKLASPTFLARNAQGTALYASSETKEGQVYGFHADASGELRLINQQPSAGSGPAHISVHPGGGAVFVANYGGGSIASYALHPDGALSTAVSRFTYTEPGKQSHAHCVLPSPDGRWLLVNDLGLDRIMVYHVDAKTALLTPNVPAAWAARAGSGPRHTVFHPNGRWLYNVNEQDSTVDLLYWDARNGMMAAQGFVSSLPADWPPHTAFCSEIVVSPDGRFVYVGNRRNETIAMFMVDPGTGALTLKQLAPHGGRTARHVTLDPSARWLLIADQDSGVIVVLARDPQTGMLSAPVHTTPLASPQCLVFSA
ncbi:lactonase family protein [Acidipila sp. EB88]|uniref:lactonase family protein n=1 Tax=Acidipila sp. EB88 TaxID=2305226 RepID=UPI000F5F1DE8|nr:lactonase family protein [Acidipila sp. EB88]RRA50265.1 lactonase family protein [Acidipila sp. EB88]